MGTKGVAPSGVVDRPQPTSLDVIEGGRLFVDSRYATVGVANQDCLPFTPTSRLPQEGLQKGVFSPRHPIGHMHSPQDKWLRCVDFDR